MVLFYEFKFDILDINMYNNRNIIEKRGRRFMVIEIFLVSEKRNDVESLGFNIFLMFV